MAHPAPDIQKVITEDGSASLYSNTYNQCYHNPNGAVSESKHIFLEPDPIRQLFTQQKKITVFETGFGTGLNLLLFLDKAIQCDINVHYTAVEAALISPEILRKSEYEAYITHKHLIDEVASMLESSRNGMNRNTLSKNIQTSIFSGLFEELELPEDSFNLFFHDAFSPDVNGELWTYETFRKLHQAATSDAILTTYCAASKARAAMAAAGWFVAKAPGALGKREMTLASKSKSTLKGYKRVNEKRLTRRLEEGDFD